MGVFIFLEQFIVPSINFNSNWKLVLLIRIYIIDPTVKASVIREYCFDTDHGPAADHFFSAPFKCPDTEMLCKLVVFIANVNDFTNVCVKHYVAVVFHGNRTSWIKIERQPFEKPAGVYRQFVVVSSLDMDHLCSFFVPFGPFEIK